MRNTFSFIDVFSVLSPSFFTLSLPLSQSFEHRKKIMSPTATAEAPPSAKNHSADKKNILKSRSRSSGGDGSSKRKRSTEDREEGQKASTAATAATTALPTATSTGRLLPVMPW